MGQEAHRNPKLAYAGRWNLQMARIRGMGGGFGGWGSA